MTEQQSYHGSESYKEMALSRVGFYDLHPVVAREQKDEPGFDVARLEERITELQASYKRYPCDAQSHSQWESKLLQRLDLTQIRADSAYLWQWRDGNLPVSYLATYYYHHHSGNSDLLETCKEDSCLGACSLEVDATVVTRDRLDSAAELGFLRDSLPSSIQKDMKILDIGSGYGRLALQINQCFPNVDVLCADAIPESTAICELYLQYRQVSSRVRVIPLPELEQQLQLTSITLATAVNSLSECTSQAIEWWIALLAKHGVPYLLIVPHSGFEEGRELYSRETAVGEHLPMMPILQKYGFVRIRRQAKYADPAMQRYGVSPTYFHLFARSTSEVDDSAVPARGHTQGSTALE